MLVLTRDTNQSIQIGDNIVVKLVSTQGQQARIAIEAPEDVKILRRELVQSSETFRSEPIGSNA